MQLSEIIAQKIREDGPVSFHDFMSMALYYPALGYYTSSKNRIGRDGDYYTSPCISSAFGELIGKQIMEMWHLSGKGNFTIVEYGAGSGVLCNDILNQARENKEFYAAIKYYLIEKKLVAEKTKIERDHQNIVWCKSAAGLSITNGCIVSNELIDNFPVHQVVMADELMEVFVDYTERFTEVLKPATDQLKDYLEQLGIRLPSGYRTEINLHAVEWIAEISSILKQGFVITIDYGFPSSQLYHDARRSGTLLCYHKHSINNAPYINIGEQDITTHVNFSALYHWGSKYGLDYTGFTNQTNFLRSLDIAGHIRKMEQNEKATGTAKTNFLTAYTLLVDMGQKLKVLIQQKKVSKKELSAFKFNWDAALHTL